MLRADDGSAAFRIIKREYTAELCRRLGRPLVSTSANITGQPTPKNFDEIDTDIRDNVDVICKADTQGGSKNPSRILKITDRGEITVIRE